MIKLTATLSKKIPIAGMNYSSQSFLAGLEVELSDAAALPEVQARIREVYQLLENSINEQIAVHQHAPASERPMPAISGSRVPYKHNNDPRARTRESANTPYPASQAQLKAIRAIAQEQGVADAEMHDLLQQRFRRQDVEELTMREASQLITDLKKRTAQT